MKAADIAWYESEWSDTGWTAYKDGVVADVVPASSGWDFGAKGWSWSVKATATVSEFPELWDCGTSPTPSKAKAKAAAALIRAAKHYAG